MEEKLQYIADKIKEIEEFIKSKEDVYYYATIYDAVEVKVCELEEFAEENQIPLKIDTEELINTHAPNVESERESSEYYDEPESNFDDEEDED